MTEGLKAQGDSRKHEQVDVHRATQADIRLSKYPLIERALSELQAGVEKLKIYSEIGPTNSIFGSARFDENHPSYMSARQLAMKLAKSGNVLLSGGGPGIMEAANRGAHDIGGMSFSCSIRLPQEQGTNRYTDDDAMFKYFFTRKILLMKGSSAIICYPGGFGTLDETFEALNLMSKGKMHPVPVVLVDKEFWQPHVSFLAQQARNLGTFKAKDFNLFRLVDNADEAYRFIKSEERRRLNDPSCNSITPNLNISEKMMERAAGEFYSAMEYLSQNGPYVSVSGSTSLSSGKYVKLAHECGRLLGENGLSTLTSDSSPLTQFLNAGVAQAGGQTSGFINPEYRPPTPSDPNLKNPLPVSYQFIREVLSHHCSAATLLFPGGYSTLDRAFELLTLTQTGKIENKPIIAIGSEYWKPLMEMAKRIHYDRYKTISAEDVDLLTIVDTPHEALHAIQKIPYKNIIA